VTSHGKTEAIVTTLLGNGDGSIRLGPTIVRDFGGFNPWWVALGFLDNDNQLDVVVGGLNLVDPTKGLHVFFGGASPRVEMGPAAVWSGTLADLNDDGDLDIITAGNAFVGGLDGSIAIMYGDGNGRFTTPDWLGRTAEDRGEVYVAAADVNRDGRLDLITTNPRRDRVAVRLAVEPGNVAFR
jgi:hypothetical protein